MFYFWAFFNPWPNICIYHNSGKFIWVSLWYIIVTKDFNIQFVFSNNKHILVDGEWSVWSLWSECSATCGYDATAIRTRACDSPSPLHGGQTCTGSQEETDECNPAAPLCMSKTFYCIFATEMALEGIVYTYFTCTCTKYEYMLM